MRARCSENCTFIINASAGCGSVFPCSIRISLNGSTEQSYDGVTIWTVPAASRANPLAAIDDTRANAVLSGSGRFAVSDTLTSRTGIFVATFRSDDRLTDAGWRLTWSAAPSPPPKFCFSRTVDSGASGYLTDGSRNDDYGNK